MKKALETGESLQGLTPSRLLRFGPAQGGEAGGEQVTHSSDGRAR